MDTSQANYYFYILPLLVNIIFLRRFDRNLLFEICMNLSYNFYIISLNYAF